MKKFTPERIKVFYAAISGWPELRDNAFFLLDPIDIDSDLARDLRASMPSERKRAEENQRSARLSEALSSIEKALERESVESWVEVAWWLKNRDSYRLPSPPLPPPPRLRSQGPSSGDCGAKGSSSKSRLQ